MGRAEERAKARMGARIAKELANKPQPFEELTPSQIRQLVEAVGNSFVPDRMYKNHLFSVQVFVRETEWGRFHKAMIRRHDAKPIHDWTAIQAIKNEIWGEDVTALEVFPKEYHKVDVANVYWIWVMADGRDCPIESRRDRIL